MHTSRTKLRCDAPVNSLNRLEIFESNDKYALTSICACVADRARFGIRCVRRYSWLLYPVLGALMGSYLGHCNGACQSGLVDGGTIGASFAMWYWIRKLRRRPMSYISRSRDYTGD